MAQPTNERECISTDAIRLGTDELTTRQVSRYGRRFGTIPVEVPAEARARVVRSNALKHELIRTRQPIYGVTTGFGDSANRQISLEKAISLQANLAR
ncbi:MAG: aromatic amino acid lyase [Janthinobacterium lividum]